MEHENETAAEHVRNALQILHGQLESRDLFALRDDLLAAERRLQRALLELEQRPRELAGAANAEG